MTSIQRYHAALREIGCIACWMIYGQGRWPVAIHHLFDPHERDDRLVVPLCEPGHHQHGVKLGSIELIPFHPGGERKFRNIHGFGEKEMLAATIQRYVEARR